MGQDCQLGQETHGGSRPTSPSLRERPLCAFQKAEQWANMQSVPANYLALLLLPGRPGLLDGLMFCVSNVRWPGSTSQRGWDLVDPSGSHLAHRTQISAGVLVGLWQTSEWRGIEKGGERRRGTQRREAEGSLSGGVHQIWCDWEGGASASSPSQRRERQKRSIFMGFRWKAWSTVCGRFSSIALLPPTVPFLTSWLLFSNAF